MVFLFVFFVRVYLCKKTFPYSTLCSKKKKKLKEKFYHFKSIKEEEEHDEDADSVEGEAASNERFQIKERIAKKLKNDTNENAKQQLQEEETKTGKKTTSRR